MSTEDPDLYPIETFLVQYTGGFCLCKGRTSRQVRQYMKSYAPEPLQITVASDEIQATTKAFGVITHNAL